MREYLSTSPLTHSTNQRTNYFSSRRPQLPRLRLRCLLLPQGQLRLFRRRLIFRRHICLSDLGVWQIVGVSPRNRCACPTCSSVRPSDYRVCSYDGTVPNHLWTEFAARGSLRHGLPTLDDTGKAIAVVGMVIGMKLRRSRGGIHRHLRPANILHDEQCDLTEVQNMQRAVLGKSSGIPPATPGHRAQRPGDRGHVMGL
jgi:hypothetical protein